MHSYILRVQEKFGVTFFAHAVFQVATHLVQRFLRCGGGVDDDNGGLAHGQCPVHILRRRGKSDIQAMVDFIILLQKVCNVNRIAAHFPGQDQNPATEGEKMYSSAIGRVKLVRTWQREGDNTSI